MQTGRRVILRLMYIALTVLLLSGTVLTPQPAAAAEPVEPVNLIVNSGFEALTAGLPTGWERWAASGTPAIAAAQDESVYKEGVRSLRLTSDATNARSAYGRIVFGAKENTQYDVNAWIRTENVVGQTGASLGATIRIQFIDAANVYAGPAFVGSIKGTNDWTLVSQRITIPPGTVRISLQCFIWEASGTVWFDGLTMTEYTPPPPEEEEDLPQANRIIAKLKAAHPNKSHPRIMADADDFARIRGLIADDPFAAGIYQGLKSDVLASFAQPLPAFVLPDGVRLLTVSQRVLSDIRKLGMMVQLEPDEGDPTPYVNRAWSILQAAGNFPSWNPSHFLDVAEMTNAFAIAYDWMYDEWTEEQREFIRNAIVTNGLNLALAAYRGQDSGAWWLNVSHNWNTVVNGGIGIGALAIADENEQMEQLAGEVLEGGLHYIQRILPTFEPDGGGEEGVGYWSYNARYFVYYVSALQSALGTDYGLSEATGVAGSPYFPIYLAGPGGSFNYGDNTVVVVNDPVYFWFADRYDDPNLGWYRKQNLDSGGLSGELDLLWYKPDMIGSEPSFALDTLFEGVDAGSMRSAWGDPYASFVGFKGGSNAYNHSHLDLGSFVMDALGVRWAYDPGADNYNLPDYFSSTGRSNYYRLRTEAHNTLVLNPGKADGQAANAQAQIVRTGSASDQSFMITDLSAAYAAHADQVQRGIQLLNDRRHILLQDEVDMKAPGEFYWFMNTSAAIEIAENGRSAILTSGDKRLWAHILTDDADVSFEVRDSVPLPGSPNPPGQAANVNPKLTIRGSGIEELRLAVLFVPLMAGETPPEQFPAVIPLSEWTVPAVEPAALERIELDGQELSGFRADTYTYYIPVEEGDAVPVVQAVAAQAGVTATVHSSETLPGLVTIRTVSADGSLRDGEYRIYLYAPYKSDEIVMASEDDGNGPINTIDGELSTRWSAMGDGQWIRFKLDEERDLDQVNIAFYSGNTRATLFDIEVSTDGSVWTQVYSGQSSGTTVNLESFAFPQTAARYVRIVGHGNTVNGWNSITEVDMAGIQRKAMPNRIARAEAQVEKSLLLVGETVQLQSQGFMQDGSLVESGAAARRYFSLNPDVASVDPHGVVQAIGYGETKVGVDMTLNGYTKTAVAAVMVDDGAIYLHPAADTYVVGGNSAGNNYGSNPILLAKNDAGLNNRREALMKFDLSDIEQPILSAKLHVMASVQDSAGTTATLAVYESLGDWTEAGVVWDTKPEYGELLNSQLVDNTFEWKEIDLTRYVQARQRQGEDVNLALLQNLDGRGLNIQIHSREHENKPYLKIRTASGEPSMTLNGPASAAAGETFDLTVGLDNYAGTALAQDMTIRFDATKVEWIGPVWLADEFILVDFEQTAPGTVRMLGVMLDGLQTHPNGPWMTLQFRAREAAAAGTVSIALEDALVADEDLVEVEIAGATHDVQITTVDKESLRGLIEQALETHANAVEGKLVGQYPAGSRAVLLAAIQAAVQVADDPQSEQDAVDQAYVQLSQSLQAFAAAVITYVPGDFNQDNKVSVSDLARVAKSYGKTSSDPDWDTVRAADLNNDGRIDISDLAQIARLIFDW